MLTRKKSKGTKPNRTSPYYNGAKKSKKMKKFSVLALAISLSLSFFNCTNDNTEGQIDYSKISESKLKQLMLEEETSARLIKVDTPGGPTDCRINVLSLFTNIKELDKEKILSSFGMFYDVRDNNLSGHSTGELYINAYYYLSSNLKNEPVTMEEITKYFDILPVVTSIKGKLNDSNFNGAVITESERDKLISLVNFYKTKKVSDSNYQALLNSIIEDITSLTNRNSTQIKEFLAS